MPSWDSIHQPSSSSYSYFCENNQFIQESMQMFSIEIPETYLLSPPAYSIKELKIDLAALLYRRKKMSLAKAARWCGLTRLEFQSELADRGMEIHFTETDLQHDLATLDKFFSK